MSFLEDLRTAATSSRLWQACQTYPRASYLAAGLIGLSTLSLIVKRLRQPPPYNWTGKTIVIVGASSGIGKSIAQLLAIHKVKYVLVSMAVALLLTTCLSLVLAARREKELNETKHTCEQLGSQVSALVGDIASPEVCKSIVDTAVTQYKGIDALFLVAGISMGALFDEVTNLDIYQRLLDVNYLSSVRIVHHALPHLAKSKGKICAVTSGAAILPFFTRTGYCASKSAAYAFFESLRTEIQSKYGIDITLVTPTVTTDTNINNTRIGFDGRVPTQRGNFDPKLGIPPKVSAWSCLVFVLLRSFVGNSNCHYQRS